MVHTTPPDPAALARRPDTAGPLAVATPTTRKLADASISVNTRRAYLGALFEAGRAPATLAVAAVRFRAKLRRPARPRRGSDRPRVGRLPSHGRRPGPGPGRPAARGRARRDSRHRRPSPHGTAGASKAPTRRNAGAAWTP